MPATAHEDHLSTENRFLEEIPYTPDYTKIFRRQVGNDNNVVQQSVAPVACSGENIQSIPSIVALNAITNGIEASLPTISLPTSSVPPTPPTPTNASPVGNSTSVTQQCSQLQTMLQTTLQQQPQTFPRLMGHYSSTTHSPTPMQPAQVHMAQSPTTNNLNCTRMNVSSCSNSLTVPHPNQITLERIQPYPPNRTSNQIEPNLQFAHRAANGPTYSYQPGSNVRTVYTNCATTNQCTIRPMDPLCVYRGNPPISQHQQLTPPPNQVITGTTTPRQGTQSVSPHMIPPVQQQNCTYWPQNQQSADQVQNQQAPSLPNYSNPVDQSYVQPNIRQMYVIHPSRGSGFNQSQNRGGMMGPRNQVPFPNQQIMDQQPSFNPATYHRRVRGARTRPAAPRHQSPNLPQPQPAHNQNYPPYTTNQCRELPVQTVITQQTDRRSDCSECVNTVAPPNVVLADKSGPQNSASVSSTTAPQASSTLNDCQRRPCANNTSAPELHNKACQFDGNPMLMISKSLNATVETAEIGTQTDSLQIDNVPVKAAEMVDRATSPINCFKLESTNVKRKFTAKRRKSNDEGELEKRYRRSGSDSDIDVVE